MGMSRMEYHQQEWGEPVLGAQKSITGDREAVGGDIYME